MRRGTCAWLMSGMLSWAAVATAEEPAPGGAVSASPPGATVSAPLPPLAEFVAAARSKAPATLEAEAVLEQRKAEKEQAILSVLPVFTASASYTRNQYESAVDIPTGGGAVETVVVAPHDQLDAALRLDVFLLDARAFYRIGAADARIDSAALTSSATQREVERAVTLAYYQRVAAEAVERSAERAVTVADENKKVVQARREAEVASDLDLERASAAVDRAKQTLAEARLQRSLATRKLKSLSGKDATGTAPPLAADLGPGVPLSTLEGKEANQPLVKSAKEDVRAAEIQQTSSWLVLVPRVSAFAQERFSNATGFGGEVATWSVGVVAEWRLDPAAIGAARTDAAVTRLAEARYAKLTQDAKDAIEDAWLEVAARREAALAARSEEVAAKKAASVAKSLYEVNKASQLDVILADRDVLSAEVARVQADANLELARANLRLVSEPAEGGP
ncbi:MAG: TolC family protein [Polyangiaceae bacterium]|jgi:outer membrane protein TolC|nr:TolC family protein [Polyangiaceae bacterium]